MFTEKSQIEIVPITKEIHVLGLNLQNSGLPINFESLGMMWGKYTAEIKKNTPNRTESQTEYGITLNKVPDYLVGMEVTSSPKELNEYFEFTIASGNYIKATFNGLNHDDLVSVRLMGMLNKAFTWAKDNNVKCNSTYTVEVYPKETVEQEYPEMYLLIPMEA